MHSENDAFRLKDMRSTPFPNRLLDAVILLPGGPAKLTCLIVRMTLGWRADEPGTRRASVCATHQGLRKALGLRSKSALSRAIASLTTAGILEVLDPMTGKLLDSQGRMRLRRPLRYRISRIYVEGSGADVDNRRITGDEDAQLGERELPN